MIAKFAKENRGMTLLEVLVATFVLVIVALPLLSLFSNNAFLIQKAYQRTDGTYKGTSLMERTYGKTYSGLFQSGKDTRTYDSITNRYYTLTLSPGGPAGVVSGTPCYFHIIVNTSGSGVFTGPNYTGSPKTLSSGSLSDLSLDATTSGTTYALRQGATTLTSGVKSANTVPVLVLLTNSDTTAIKVATSGDCTAIVYCMPTLDTTKIVTTTTPILYNNDAPPTTLLVTAILKVYKTTSDPQPEGLYQNTLSVGSLP